MGIVNLFLYIPLFGVLLIVYLILAMLGVDFSHEASSLFEFTLISGAKWAPKIGDFFLMLGVFTLYIEVLKSTRTTTASVIEHTLSVFVFIIYVLVFFIFESAGTSTFMVLTLMSLFDVIAGFTITISAARRDMSFGGG